MKDTHYGNRPGLAVALLLAVLAVPSLLSNSGAVVNDHCPSSNWTCTTPNPNCAKEDWCVQRTSTCPFPNHPLWYEQKWVQGKRCTQGNSVLYCTACNNYGFDGSCCAFATAEDDCPEQCL